MCDRAMCVCVSEYVCRGSRGLMDRALDLKPEVTQGCGFESRLWQEVSTTEVRSLSKAPNPQTAAMRRNGWVKCRECVNKAHVSDRVM